MSEYEFEKRMLESIARIETMIADLKEQYEPMSKELKEVHQMAIIADQASKSAHHRINTIYIIAGLIGGIVSFLVNLFQK